MKGDKLPAALATGAIDAFSMREPFIGEAQKLLDGTGIVFQEPGMYLKTMNLVALNRLVDERSEPIIEFAPGSRFPRVYGGGVAQRYLPPGGLNED